MKRYQLLLGAVLLCGSTLATARTNAQGNQANEPQNVTTTANPNGISTSQPINTPAPTSTKNATNAPKPDSTYVDTTQADTTTYAAMSQTNDTSNQASAYNTNFLLLAAALLLALVAIIIAITALTKLGKLRKSYRRKQNEQEFQNDGALQRCATLSKRVNDLEQQLKSVCGEISTLRASLQRQSVSRNANSATTTASTPTATKTPTRTLYASETRNGGFDSAQLRQQPSSYTMVILTLQGQQGSFVINDASNAQQNLLANINFGVTQIADINSQSASPQRIVTDEPGQLQLNGNIWKVVKKAKIRLI